MWWLAWLLLAFAPSYLDAEPWLGRWAAGPETIAFRWNEGLEYHHGNVIIPVDGAWHVTVPEFYVRHRVTWRATGATVLLEETHDASEPWRHELRLDGERISKVSLSGGPDGGEILVRTYEKVKEGARCGER